MQLAVEDGRVIALAARCNCGATHWDDALASSAIARRPSAARFGTTEAASCLGWVSDSKLRTTCPHTWCVPPNTAT